MFCGIKELSNWNNEYIKEVKGVLVEQGKGLWH